MLLYKRLELVTDLIDKRMLNFNKEQRQWLYIPPHVQSIIAFNASNVESHVFLDQ